ncbi:threonine-phosphate decarboxylase CobD [Methyloceanibacter caenitepidi]|uniref:threonine-phosphate decarboxylase CobD n=1 Tax=Methyloceanibacter caenitepidi TaxID=1384459 RepID=UPI0009E3EF51|nr:threonine-phosphate decarboxylase CobD [Methyloceanibacter caenitepidi]
MTSPDPYPLKSLAAAYAADETHAPFVHGGDRGAARAQFPNAPQPIVDLSTGVNPHPYPIADCTADDFAHLPDPGALARLLDPAAAVYGAPSTQNVVAAPGSQILMALIADLLPQGPAAILGPTYAEHARIAALAGHTVVTVQTLAELEESTLAVVVNPNNPDGRVTSRDDLLRLADRQSVNGGILVVDEAFMDVGPNGASVADQVEQAPIAVLRSFGKFFGLAGLRLSFALTNRALARQLRARLGPWPVSGPALSIGAAAFADKAWIDSTRTTLRAASERLEMLLRSAGLTPLGRTDLFCLVSSPRAQAIFTALGEAGIFVRRFDENPQALRFGLPGNEVEWQRLSGALKSPS